MDRISEFLANVIILDTETTNKVYKEAEIVELGAICNVDGQWVELVSKLYKPLEKIPAEASAVNHITNKMVEHLPHFADDCSDIVDIFNNVVQSRLALAAHNSPYDRGVIMNYSEVPVCDRWLCTMRFAKRLFIEDSTVTQYNLQYLRYRFELEVGEVDTHRAVSDCMVCGKLLEFLVNEMECRGILDSNFPYLEQILEWVAKPIFIPTITLGKHKGSVWDDVPTDYVIWAINNLDCLRTDNPLYDPDMEHTLAIVMEGRV